VKVDSLSSLPLEAQISAAVARKAQSVQEQIGQAAIQLIDGGAAESGMAPAGDGRGELINTRA
jgi:hypothetical protein